MGTVNFGIPERLAATVARQLQLTVAVETGTFYGGSTRLLGSIFDRVISIELSDQLHAAAVDSLADLANVTLVHGASSEQLPRIVSGLERPALYWLDGHWCEAEGDTTGGYEAQCPILAEIRAIDEGSQAAGSCILIDDARMYLGPPPLPYRRSDWPTFTEVVDCLRAVHRRSFTVLEDVIIAGPPEIQAAIDTYWTEKQWLDLIAERNHHRDRLDVSRRLQAVAHDAVAALRRIRG